ncbi:MAG: hypothetical protein H6825_00320 [Planctomycetes bacterium]|nr:hypothetical protein [Planctomycetota bacterium]
MQPSERDRGPQPLAALLERHALSHHALVDASDEQLTHKMVARGCKGRWLTPNVRAKLVRALNRATGESYVERDLFDYA